MTFIQQGFGSGCRAFSGRSISRPVTPIALAAAGVVVGLMASATAAPSVQPAQARPQNASPEPVQPAATENPNAVVSRMLKVGDRVKLRDRTGVWQVMGLTMKPDGQYQKFQQMSADLSRLVARKTCSYPANEAANHVTEVLLPA